MSLRSKARRSGRLALAVAAVSVVALAGVAAASPQNQQGGGHRASADWPMWQKSPNGTRFNADEKKITPATAGSLKLKWAYTYAPVPNAAHGSQPAIVDGVLYVGAPDAKFLALDAKTGATKWAFDLSTVVKAASNDVRDGASVVGNRVYFGDSTGRIYALDKATGTLVWAKSINDNPTSVLTGSPLVFDGKVYIGESTTEGGMPRDPNYACCTHRGQVVALDAGTGAVAWRYYTMPAAKQVGTWPSGAAKFAPSGGSVWSTPVVDAQTRTIFVGTGNSMTGEEGDTDSVLAISADTGKVRWKQKAIPRDVYTAACGAAPGPTEYCPGKGEYAFDADFGASANVITVGGRTLVTIGQKGGLFHAYDARTGAIAWETRLEPLDPHAADPGSSGVQWASVYDGKWLYAATHRGNPGKLYALDPATGKIMWRSPHPADGCTTGGAAASPDLCELAYTPAVSGTPGLIYEGSSDGKFRVYSSADGSVLFTYDAVRDFTGVNGPTGHGSGISGTGGAVIVDGMVYVQAGYYPFYPSNGKGAVLLAFGL
jgi:polyvinyl alcohol dehydrogenase (cytochrome)